MLFQLKFASFSRIFILSTKIYALSHPSSNIVFRTREKNHVIVENLVMKVCYQKLYMMEKYVITTNKLKIFLYRYTNTILDISFETDFTM